MMGSTAMRLMRDRRGQMTVELAIVLPVVIVIAVIAVNACTFFSECAAFDRVSRNAVRMVATAPAHGQTPEESVSRVRSTIESQMGEGRGDVSVSVEQSAGCLRYTMSMRYSPTLFGMGFRESVLGVALPKLEHSSSLSIIPYKPGMLL